MQKVNMQTVKNISSVVGSGMEGYQTGQRHGRAIAGAAQSFDTHMKNANRSAIAGRPYAHDALVRKYANNQLASAATRYYNHRLPAHMPGPKTPAYYSYRLNLPTSEGAGRGLPGQQKLLAHVRRN